VEPLEELERFTFEQIAKQELLMEKAKQEEPAANWRRHRHSYEATFFFLS